MNPFWDWALKAYGGEGVAQACLALQDDHGQCVPLILWGVWCSLANLEPAVDITEAAVDTARAWSETVIVPLRAIRRRLKSPVSDMDTAARESLRARLKADELEAERLLMQTLYALAKEAPLRRENNDNVIAKDAIDRLAVLSKAWNGIVARPALNSLLEALTKGDFLRYNPLC